MDSLIISDEYKIGDPRRWLCHFIMCLLPNVCFSVKLFFDSTINHLHGKDIFVVGVPPPPVIVAQAPQSVK